jgi:hypothetical protein
MVRTISIYIPSDAATVESGDRRKRICFYAVTIGRPVIVDRPDPDKASRMDGFALIVS